MTVVELLIALQLWMHGTLTGHVTGFSASHDWGALAAVLPLGMLFGAVHAMTPGHGKSVLASYLVGSRLAVLRGLSVAGVLAFVHVFSAVVLALVAAPLVSSIFGVTGRAPALEGFSRGLLAVIGVWFIVRACRGHRHGHSDGVLVGAVAGLVPCPLTLFVMFLAIGEGVPEAGMTFAVAMMLGVATTLCVVALLTVTARDLFTKVITHWGASIGGFSRVLDGLAGLLLLAIGMRGLLAA